MNLGVICSERPKQTEPVCSLSSVSLSAQLFFFKRLQVLERAEHPAVRNLRKPDQSGRKGRSWEKWEERNVLNVRIVR